MTNEQEVLRRIERLEKQSRRMKVLGVLILLLLCALITTAQKSSKKTGKTRYRPIEASSILVKDEKGADRIKISPNGIEIYDSQGKFAGAIREDISILNHLKASQFSVFDPNGRDRIRLAMNGERPSIQMMNEEGKVRTAVGQEAIVLLGNTIDEYNSMTSNGISIRDANRSTATVGVTETVNKSSGEQSRTSAATITLFGKDGKVLWQAP